MWHTLKQFYNSAQWNHIRNIVVAERSQKTGNITCEYCGNTISSFGDVEIDHIKELTLDNDTINTLLCFQEQLKVKVTMPKFTTEQSYDFTDTLKAMGINAMFQNSNDFSGMYTEGNQMCISDVLQKTKIIVNEQGTEAASGTASFGRGMNMDEPAVFRADRPFIYMITAHHYDTEEVLFIGQYVTAKQ